MPYKSANIQNAGFQSFQSQGFTQANSSGNNQLDLGEFFFFVIFWFWFPILSLVTDFLFNKS